MKRMIMIISLLTMLVSLFSQDLGANVQRLRVQLPDGSMDFLYDSGSKKLVGLEMPNPDDASKPYQFRGDGIVKLGDESSWTSFEVSVRGVPGQTLVAISEKFDFGGLWGFMLMPNGQLKLTQASSGKINVIESTWMIVKVVSNSIDGTYQDPNGLIRLTISGQYFTMSFNGRDAGAGKVERKSNQLILQDARDMTIWTINNDGSLSTNTYGLAGTWRKVQ